MLKLIVILQTYFLFRGIHGIDAEMRILGGEDASLGQFPYALSIRTIEDDNHICTGVVILQHWALTNAHCLLEPERKSHEIFLISDGVSKSLPEGTNHYVKQIVVHENFKIDPKHYDVAVIEVREPFFTFWSSIFGRDPKDLLFGDVKYGDDLTAIGWSINNVLVNNDNLKFTKIKVKEDTKDDECATGSSLFCVKFESGVGVSVGDIGGPVVKVDENRLVGILRTRKGNCYTRSDLKVIRLQYFKEWLREATYSRLDIEMKWE